MKRFALIVISGILLVGGVLFHVLSRGPEAELGQAVEVTVSPGKVPGRIPADAVIIEGAEEWTEDLHSEEIDPVEDLAILQQILYVYRQANGSNPQGGLNEEIVERLLGYNERNVRFLPEPFPFLNERGELVDRWGSPYFFHPVSAEVMEIVSAGPDRELWTEDDLTIQ